MSNGVDVRLAETYGDYNGYVWDGWLPVPESYEPPLPDGSPGPPQPTTTDFIAMMDATYVRKDDLVIAPDPPAVPKGPGVIYIDNTTGS
jgi:hypothetical protein